MLAFLLFTMILLASYGLIHKMWNMKRDKQDAIDAQSTYSCLHNMAMVTNTRLQAALFMSTLRTRNSPT